MLRRVLLSFLALAATPAQAQLPNFEFRGIVAGQPVDVAALGFKNGCRNEDRGVTCTRGNDSIASVPAVAIYRLYAGRLGWLSFDFYGTEASRVLAATVEKYGKPCRTEQREWRNRAGTTFPNTVLTWCFATGDLTLSERGVQRDYGSFFYQDREVLKTYNPPTAPTVDF